MKPRPKIELTGDDAARMQKLLDALEDLDDVQDVYTTAVIELRRQARRACLRREPR